MQISKDEIYTELDNLIEDGRAILKTKWVSYNRVMYVDPGKYKSWHTKTLAYVEEIIPTNSQHIKNLADSSENRYSYAENCVLSLGNMKEQLKKGQIPFAPQVISQSLHDEIQLPKILVSHSSEDKYFCNIFIEFLASIGFTEDTLIYTSKSEFAVPLGKDIFDYLRIHLNNKIWVFFMLSHNFYNSPPCLNEMGAAWVKQSQYYSILLPGFKHEERKGAINLKEQTLNLSDPVHLTQLLHLFRKTWSLTITDTRWAAIQTEFIEKIKAGEQQYLEAQARKRNGDVH